jgi:hypothetical protein
MSRKSRFVSHATPIALLVLAACWSVFLAARGLHAQTSAFAVGARVQTTAKVSVRSTPAGARLGNQKKGVAGTIVAGPTKKKGEVWWKVDYQSGVDGWSIQRRLRIANVAAPAVPPPPPPADTTPPSTPLALSATPVSPSQIDLAWNPSSDNAAVAGYRVFRGQIQVATPTTNSYSDTGLTPATSYTYTVQAHDTAENSSEFSASVSAKTLALPSFQKATGSFTIPERPPPGPIRQTSGVESGIPARTTICADVTKAPYEANNTGAASAVSAIQNAINNCPAGQVVYVPAGIYRIDNRILIHRSITLRGAGPSTVFRVSTGNPILMQGRMPWPPPRNNPYYVTTITGGAMRGSTSLTVANAASVATGNMIMVEDTDAAAVVPSGHAAPSRSHASMHLVESRKRNTLTFRPPLPIDYAKTSRVSWFPDVLQNAGVEDIKFVGNGFNPAEFIRIASAWNVWVKGSEFAGIPSKAVAVSLSGHVELRGNHVHGRRISESLDLSADVHWSLAADNVCSTAGAAPASAGESAAGTAATSGFRNEFANNACGPQM